MKKMTKLMSIVLVLSLCLTIVLQGATSASAATFSNPYMQRVADYIREHGTYSDKGYMLFHYDDDGDYTFYYVIRLQSDGLYFNVLMDSDLPTYCLVSTDLVLKDNSASATVSHTMIYYYNGYKMDSVYTTKKMTISNHTENSQYDLQKSGKYISNSMFSEYFNDMMELMFLHWDVYLYTELGFGMKALGFTKYDGLGPAPCTSHTYSNSCDTSCNNCGYIRTVPHNWDSGKITVNPTCATTGQKTFTCKTCGTTKTESVGVTNDHSYGKWSNYTDYYHAHYCTECNHMETASHTWDNGKVTTPATCSATGIMTYTCTGCGATKTESIAKNNDHSYTSCYNLNEQQHEFNCSACGHNYVTYHNWKDGAIIEMPTVDSTGLRELECVDCGATKTVVMPKCADGDLNMDQTVDNKDVEYLLWHTLFPDSYPLDTYADFDMNGIVDNKDVEYLLWHTLFPDSYPLNAK